MKNITIPVNISSDIMISLNQTEQELKNHFQARNSHAPFPRW